MKTLTCHDLGGPCDEKISAETWDGMVKAMTMHVVQTHQETAKAMEEMHKADPTQWGREHKPKWDAAPERSTDRGATP